MSTLFDLDRTHRRDRTFAGGQCVICEEPLEHTLRGERIFQLSCGHVTHEACFYEYIQEPEPEHCPRCEAPLGLDASRGGNILNVEKLSAIVSSLQKRNDAPIQPPTYTSHTPIGFGSPAKSSPRTPPRTSNEHFPPRTSNENFHDRPRSRTKRHGSGKLSARQSKDHLRAAQPRDDFDNVTLQSAEPSSVKNRSLSAVRNPIPPPNVTIRGEYPSLTHSRQPQSLTCLVTVEVPEGNWTPKADDFVQPHPVARSGSVRDNASIFDGPGSEEVEVFESPEELQQGSDELHSRIDNWHGLDFTRFGKLRLHGKALVGKDRQSWQELWCFLFEEMLICVKEKRVHDAGDPQAEGIKYSLKGSIQITRHLRRVESLPEHSVVTLSLSVPDFPFFNLHFQNRKDFQLWQGALSKLDPEHQPSHSLDDTDDSILDSEDTETEDGDDDDDGDSQVDAPDKDGFPSQVESSMDHRHPALGRAPPKPNFTSASSGPLHVPVDIVVVLPISSSMHGLKISLLRDTLRYIIHNLGPRDRLGLVTFGAAEGAQPIVGMSTKSWGGWSQLIDAIRAVGHRGTKGDLIEGANVAMDLLMQRKSTNPLSSILIISDSPSTEAESVDFVVSRAEAAKVSIFCFGLGLTHKPDIMIELATRTKASYVYVKDWMMLRECVAGCLGSLQSTSHQAAKLKLRLPDGSPTRFVKISGAMQITKRSSGRDVEVTLGDLRFGDKRDILVRLAVDSGHHAEAPSPVDAWESIVSGLEALGGGLDGSDDTHVNGIEEVPVLQADLTYGDLLREGATTQLARPALLAITILPASGETSTSELGHNGISRSRPGTPPIPPHPSVVARRMELLTSDMLTRALTFVSKGQHEQALLLLRETRSILRGLGKGSLPPIPPQMSRLPGIPSSGSTSPTLASPNSSITSLQAPNSSTTARSSTTTTNTDKEDTTTGPTQQPTNHNKAANLPSSPTLPPTQPHPSTNPQPSTGRTSTPISHSHPIHPPHHLHPAHHSTTHLLTKASLSSLASKSSLSNLNPTLLTSLDAELDSALEWLQHPSVFARDSRKAVLQAIGVVSSQRAYTFRTGLEGLFAGRVRGVSEGVAKARDWRMVGMGDMAEEN